MTAALNPASAPTSTLCRAAGGWGLLVMLGPARGFVGISCRGWGALQMRPGVTLVNVTSRWRIEEGGALGVGSEPSLGKGKEGAGDRLTLLVLEGNGPPPTGSRLDLGLFGS